MMTTLGGIGHTLPFLITQFWTAMTLAIAVVVVELAVISWIRRSGGAPSPSGADPIGHIRFLQATEDRSGSRERACWFLEPVDFLSMCFTGTPAASPA